MIRLESINSTNTSLLELEKFLLKIFLLIDLYFKIFNF